MEEIGLFPLGFVLLPTEQVPLHIFEPRYRELIAECLANEQPFGLVYADDDGLRQAHGRGERPEAAHLGIVDLQGYVRGFGDRADAAVADRQDLAAVARRDFRQVDSFGSIGMEADGDQEVAVVDRVSLRA